MATSEQVTAFYVKRNAARGLEELEWADFVAEMSLEIRIELIDNIRALKRQKIADVIMQAARRAVVKNLEEEAALLIADGQLSLEELDNFI